MYVCINSSSGVPFSGSPKKIAWMVYKQSLWYSPTFYVKNKDCH